MLFSGIGVLRVMSSFGLCQTQGTFLYVFWVFSHDASTTMFHCCNDVLRVMSTFWFPNSSVCLSQEYLFHDLSQILIWHVQAMVVHWAPLKVQGCVGGIHIQGNVRCCSVILKSINIFLQKKPLHCMNRMIILRHQVCLSVGLWLHKHAVTTPYLQIHAVLDVSRQIRACASQTIDFCYVSAIFCFITSLDLVLACLFFLLLFLPSLQVFLDVLPVCKFGLCCTNSPENSKLEATV